MTVAEMDVVIVGAGRAGTGQYPTYLQQARPMLQAADIKLGSLVYVDISRAAEERTEEPVFPRLEQVPFARRSTVVHVVTPPATHASVAQSAIEMGFRRIVVEKPVALSSAELRDLQATSTRTRASVVVSAPWLHTLVLDRIREIVEERRLGEVTGLDFVSDKPRFEQGLTDTAHRTAFEIEVPHLVGVALRLCGRLVRVVSGHCADLVLGETRVPHLGGAACRLEHDGMVTSDLSSDLSSPRQKRSLKVRFERGTVAADFPLSQADQVSHLRVWNRADQLVEARRFLEAPMSRFVASAYTGFANRASVPCNGLRFNLDVVSALEGAEVAAGLRSRRRRVARPVSRAKAVRA